MNIWKKSKIQILLKRKKINKSVFLLWIRRFIPKPKLKLKLLFLLRYFFGFLFKPKYFCFFFSFGLGLEHGFFGLLGLDSNPDPNPKTPKNQAPNPKTQTQQNSNEIVFLGQIIPFFTRKNMLYYDVTAS